MRVNRAERRNHQRRSGYDRRSGEDRRKFDRNTPDRRQGERRKETRREEDFQEEKRFDDQIEGRNSVLELLESDRDINKIYVSRGEKHGSINEIVARAKENKVVLEQKQKVTHFKIKINQRSGIVPLKVENLKFGYNEKNIFTLYTS